MTTKQVTAADLRNARKQRLASEKAGSEKSADSNSVSAPEAKPVEQVIPPSMQGKGEAPKADKAEVKPSDPSGKSDGSKEVDEKAEEKKADKADAKDTAKDTKSSEGEDCGTGMKSASLLTTYVVDASAVPLSAKIEGVLFGEDTSTPHWLVFANGEPVGKIPHTAFSHYNDPKGAMYFKSAQYMETLKKAAKVEPLIQVLTTAKAELYAAKVAELDAYRALETKAVKTASAELAKDRTQVIDTYRNMLNLVVAGMNQNYIPSNPLKFALFEEMTRVGVQDPSSAIETAFRNAGAQHFDMMFNQAEQWMGFSPQAQEDVRRQIEGMGHRAPVAREAATAPLHHASQRHDAPPSAANNVPLAPRSEQLSRTAGVDDLKDSLGFGAEARLNRALGNGRGNQ